MSPLGPLAAVRGHKAGHKQREINGKALAAQAKCSYSQSGNPGSIPGTATTCFGLLSSATPVYGIDFRGRSLNRIPGPDFRRSRAITLGGGE